MAAVPLFGRKSAELCITGYSERSAEVSVPGRRGAEGAVSERGGLMPV